MHNGDEIQLHQQLQLHTTETSRRTVNYSMWYNENDRILPRASPPPPSPYVWQEYACARTRDL